mmetsp:Transcript_12146/g.15512  ORF Transcript_12146/g.15512 Transcript_12146/m.15512 type:complete len:92 (-) Transcript_12146:26-301(-)
MRDDGRGQRAEGRKRTRVPRTFLEFGSPRGNGGLRPSRLSVGAPSTADQPQRHSAQHLPRNRRRQAHLPLKVSPLRRPNPMTMTHDALQHS